MRGTKNKQLRVYLKYENYLTDKKQFDRLIKILDHNQRRTKSKREKLWVNTELSALIKLHNKTFL